MDHVFEAYVAGDAGEYDTVLARTLAGAQACAEETFKDYFGDPIDWGKTREDGAFVSGQYYAAPHQIETVIVARVEVDPR